MFASPLKKILIVLLIASTTPVQSEDKALMELLKALLDSNTIDQKTHDLIRDIANPETTPPVDQPASQAISQQASPPTVRQPDKITIGGRIQADAAFYRDHQSTHQDGTELRRARLFAQGNISTAWRYKLQYDFTGTGRDGIRDTYLGYQFSDTTKLQIGNIKQPFSLQSLTSSKHILFTERALPDTFSPGRSIGLKINHAGSNHQASVGIFGDRVDSTGDNEDFSFTGRFSMTPIQTVDKLWHVGASASYQNNNSRALRLSTRPESHITNTRIIDTGDIDSAAVTRFVAETAFIHKAWHGQAEYYHARLDNRLGSALKFSGFYLAGSWFLTGESMQYKTGQGIFSAIKPNSIVGEGGIGAWQLAVRFSSLDLTDGNINGGQQDNLSLGLNWYATPKIRFTMNYINTLAVDGGTYHDDTLQLLQFRTQVAF